HLDRRHDVVERLLENSYRTLLGLAFDDLTGAIDDRFGDRLLAFVHHRIHEFGNDKVSEFRIRIDFALVGGVTAGHGSLTYLSGSLARLLRPLGAVLRTALLAVLDALRIEHAAQDVVAHAREVLHAAAADHDHRVLLQIVALARNVTDHLEAVGQAYFCDFAQRRVRLLRRCRVDARADAAFLRRVLQRRHGIALGLLHPRLADQLI